MEIRTLNDDVHPGVLAEAIERYFRTETRFTCGAIVKQWYKRGGALIRISNIRLKESKKWCGSHPAQCDVPATRRATFLEGADWVEWNDRLNDLLDSMNVSANVRSAVCILRKDVRRRTHYGMYYQAPLGVVQRTEWNEDEDYRYYEDYRGRIAPASYYPEGTPGLYERKVNAVPFY